MFNRVVTKEEQFLTPEDLNRMGTFPQTGIDALLKSLFGLGRYYRDFTVTGTPGTTSIGVAPGLVYDAGKMYAFLIGETRSIAEFVPFEAGKMVIVTIIAQGREAPSYRESRQMEREVVQTGGGATTQLVPELDFRAMTRDVVVTLNAGAQSLNPVRPAPILGTVEIADLLIGTGGLVSITPRTEALAPQLIDLATMIAAQQATIGLLGQEVGGLRTDLAALSRRLNEMVSRTTLAALTGDVAAIKDRLDMPDTGTPYGADRYLSTAETDVLNVDYKARVEEGVRFPYANFNKSAIGLGIGMANSPNLMHTAQGLICPKYSIVEGIKVSPRAGSLPLGGTTYQTMELTTLTMSRESQSYGPYFERCENSAWWQSGRYDVAKGTLTIAGTTYEVGNVTGNYGKAGHQIYRLRQMWTTTVQEPYDVYAPVAHTITGVVKAQSWVQSQGRYTPGIRLAIESWSAGAEITAVLVECGTDGKPNKRRHLASCTLGAADFVAYTEKNGQRTRLPWDRPYWLKQGMFAVMFATKGDVSVAYAEGQDFLGGTYYVSTDGEYFDGDLTRDLCMSVEYCSFDLTRLPVSLVGLNLDGGIHNLDVRAAMLVPTNADARWALQVGGQWRQLPRPDQSGNLVQEDVPVELFGAGTTPYYDFRVELAGNQWEMPLIDLNVSEVTVFRADDDFRHISIPRLLGANSTSIVVRAVVNPWDPARHALACRLLTGAGYATLKAHDAVVTKPVVGRPDARELQWTFNFAGPGIDRFKVDFLGTTNNARIGYLIDHSVYDA